MTAQQAWDDLPGSPPNPSAPVVPRSHHWLPRTIRPTRTGWWFIGATLVIGLAATNTGNNLLYLILAMLLSLMAVSGLLSEQTLRRVRLHRELPGRLFAGAPGTFGVRVVNGKRRLPSYALHLTEPDPSGRPAVARFFLKIPPQGCERWRHDLTFPRRGRHRLPGLRLSTRFPFGLFTKISRPLLADPVLVYPAVRPLAPHELPAILEAGWRERYRRGGGTGLYNLRPYRPGDDPRLVHWKTSARMGDLILKESEEEDRPRLRFTVEDPPPGAPADRIEADLSYVASLAALAVRHGAVVELVAGEGSTGSGTGETHLDRMLACLALYTIPARPRPPRANGDLGHEVRVRLGVERRGEAGG
jgi:uncharacterized protein (DUF58 family)